MIIILGPDHTGKTTLAKAIADRRSLKYFHFTRESAYEDYLEPLCSLDMYEGVLDRYAICEFPYSRAMNREFKFTMKQWHNLVLTALIQKPIIILCTNKPTKATYSRDQYLPYDAWDICMYWYKMFLNTHHIGYIEFDYTREHNLSSYADTIADMADRNSADMSWWKVLWTRGWGCIGSTHPKVLMVAERIGPNNTHNIPFETGPTGYMLSDLLTKTATPLGKFAVTNLVKSYRRDDRPPSEADMALLSMEIDNLRPEKVVFLGAVAKKGAKIAKQYNIPYTEYVHFGYYSHKGSTSIDRYVNNWRQVFNIVPSKPL
jgi:uracil-DNA glycosylase